MVHPLPALGTERLGPPDAAEAQALATAMASTVADPVDGLTDLQGLLFPALFHSLTGQDVTFAGLPAFDADLAASVLAERNLAFRTRVVQMCALVALVRVPLPADLADRVGAFADALEVRDDSLTLAREYAHGSLGLAVIDFDRNGYAWDPDSAMGRLHTSAPSETAWAFAEDDAALAARWTSLEELPAGTLGRRLTEFYRARGFTYPGLPGSAPPYLAQHDWVHVLADYGTTVESELEVFGLIARATDDPRGFSLLAMVIGLFETGYVRTAAGLFESDTGHLSRTGMAARLGDALRRGALAGPTGDGGGDVAFMDIDWWSVADLPVTEARRRFGIVAKDPVALAAGSVGPWEPGGISPYQLAAGQRRAVEEDRPYDAFGALSP